MSLLQCVERRLGVPVNCKTVDVRVLVFVDLKLGYEYSLYGVPYLLRTVKEEIALIVVSHDFEVFSQPMVL